MPLIRVNVKIEKKFDEQMLINTINTGSKKLLEDSAKATLETVRSVIMSKIKRVGSTGNLANGFTMELREDWAGVGDIDHLNKTVKYWYWQNYGKAQSGRSIPPGAKEFPRLTGHFEPEQNGRFVKSSPRFPIYPERAIPPMNYIEDTWNKLVTQIIPNLSRRG